MDKSGGRPRRRQVPAGTPAGAALQRDALAGTMDDFERAILIAFDPTAQNAELKARASARRRLAPFVSQRSRSRAPFPPIRRGD